MPIVVPCVVLLTLPWLWPFTAGPVAGTLPYLMAAGAGALLLIMWPRDARAAYGAAATAWLIAASLSALIGLLQYFDLEALFYPWVNVAEPGQAFGNLRQPNQLATLLMIGLLSLHWLRRRHVLSSGSATSLAVLLLVALAATASRVGLTELLMVGVLAFWWRRHNMAQRRLTLLVGMAALSIFAVAALTLPLVLKDSEGLAGRALVDRLQHAESTCGSRLILWRNVLHLIALKPWLGWGWGELDYAHYITLYEGARFCHILDNAHNLPLHIAVELGVPAALLFCAAVVWAVWRGRPWAEQDATRRLAWGVLGVIGIHSLVEYPLWYGPFQIAVAICVWLLWVTRPALHGVAPEPRMGLRYSVAAALLVATAYAGWDYHRVSQIYLPMEQRAAMYRDDTMSHAQRSWLYADVVRFAEVTTRPAIRDNAAWMLPAALQTLHFSPEPRVIQKVIESATLLGRDDVALAHLARFHAAFEREASKWSLDNRRVSRELDDLRGQDARN